MNCRRRHDIVETALEIATIVEVYTIRSKNETCTFSLTMIVIVLFAILHALFECRGKDERIDVLRKEISVAKHSPDGVVSCE